MLLGLSVPTLLTIASTAFFLALERLAPGRPLPRVRGWYARALAINLVQLVITLGMNRVWRDLLAGPSLFHLARWEQPALEGLCAWLHLLEMLRFRDVYGRQS